MELLTHWEEPGGEGLGGLGADLARVLDQPPLSDIDVLELEGSDGSIAGAG